MIFEKLSRAEDRFREIEQLITLPDIVSNNQEYSKLMKEYKSLTPIIDKYREYKVAEKEMRDSDDMMRDSSLDSELRELAEFEYKTNKEKCELLTDELRILLMPRDPNDSKNVIVEIRQGAGGEEAALFGAVLCRMYQNYCAAHRLKVEEIYFSDTELGGVKEAVYNIVGAGAYKLLKYESGVHRVQRVPETETQGRIHTSTATVAVLPEAEEVEVEINEKDIRIDIFHSGGAGGQNVNKVASAVRITHFPTGIVVTCQDERSQLKNKERAFKVLRSRLFDFYNGKSVAEREQNRKSLVGSGDRSERIRTYNFPQSRVTDHRINLSQYNLEAFVSGEIDSMVEALTIADREAMLSSEE